MLFQQLLHLGPDAGGNERPGAGGALLALELKGAADDGGGQRLDIGGGVGKDEVLAAGFAHQAGIVGVGGDVLAHLLPHALEHGGGAGEVESRHLGMAHHIFGHIASGTGHEIDDPCGQAAPLEQLHVIVIGQRRGAGGLPQCHVAHDGRGGGQVAADGGKVEGGNGADEAVQRTVVLAVPDPVDAGGLLLEDLLRPPDAEAEEVRQLGNVNFRLEHGLGLAQHGGGVEYLPVGAGNHVGGLQEDGGAVLPGHGLPGILGGQGRVDGHLQLLLPCHAALGDDVLVVMRHGDGNGVLRPDLPTANDEGDLDHLAGLLRQLLLQSGPLRTAGQVTQEGIVLGAVDGKIRIWHDCLPPFIKSISICGSDGSSIIFRKQDSTLFLFFPPQFFTNLL